MLVHEPASLALKIQSTFLGDLPLSIRPMLENLNDSSNSILPLRGPQLSYSNVIANIEAFHQSSPGIIIFSSILHSDHLFLSAKGDTALSGFVWQIRNRDSSQPFHVTTRPIAAPKIRAVVNQPSRLIARPLERLPSTLCRFETTMISNRIGGAIKPLSTAVQNRAHIGFTPVKLIRIPIIVDAAIIK